MMQCLDRAISSKFLSQVYKNGLTGCRHSDVIPFPLKINNGHYSVSSTYLHGRDDLYFDCLELQTQIFPAFQDSSAVLRTAPAMSSMMATMDEDDLPTEQKQCLSALREGKRLLKEKHGASAMVRFEKALMLSKSTGQKINERRATRGLAASARLQVAFHVLHPLFIVLIVWNTPSNAPESAKQYFLRICTVQMHTMCHTKRWFGLILKSVMTLLFLFFHSK